MKNITEDTPQDYVDGRLDLTRRQEVEAYLADNPADAERLAAYGAQKQALHALYDPVLDEPVPPAMDRPPGTPWRELSGLNILGSWALYSSISNLSQIWLPAVCRSTP